MGIGVGDEHLGPLRDRRRRRHPGPRTTHNSNVTLDQTTRNQKKRGRRPVEGATTTRLPIREGVAPPVRLREVTTEPLDDVTEVEEGEPAVRSLVRVSIGPEGPRYRGPTD